MSILNRQGRNANKPPRVVALPEGYFREGCNAPVPGNLIGVRRLGALDISGIRREAKETHDDWGETEEGAFKLHAVCRSLVMPDDVRQHYLQAGEMEAKRLFTPEGRTYLFDIVAQLHVSTSPLYEPVSDPELDQIAKLITAPDTWKKLGVVKGGFVRRMLRFILDYLVSLRDRLRGL